MPFKVYVPLGYGNSREVQNVGIEDLGKWLIRKVEGARAVDL